MTAVADLESSAMTAGMVEAHWALHFCEHP